MVSKLIFFSYLMLIRNFSFILVEYNLLLQFLILFKGLIKSDVVKNVLCLLTFLKDSEVQKDNEKLSTPSPWISSAGKV